MPITSVKLYYVMSCYKHIPIVVIIDNTKSQSQDTTQISTQLSATQLLSFLKYQQVKPATFLIF